MIALVAIGFLIYGPVMLVGLYALELVPKKAAGTAAGLTGLFGYLLGTVSANAVVGYRRDAFGCNGGFMVMIASCLISIALFVMTMRGHQDRRRSARRRQGLNRRVDGAAAVGDLPAGGRFRGSSGSDG